MGASQRLSKVVRFVRSLRQVLTSPAWTAGICTGVFYSLTQAQAPSSTANWQLLASLLILNTWMQDAHMHTSPTSRS